MISQAKYNHWVTYGSFDFGGGITQGSTELVAISLLKKTTYKIQSKYITGGDYATEHSDN